MMAKSTFVNDRENMLLVASRWIVQENLLNAMSTRKEPGMFLLAGTESHHYLSSKKALSIIEQQLNK